MKSLIKIITLLVLVSLMAGCAKVEETPVVSELSPAEQWAKDNGLGP